MMIICPVCRREITVGQRVLQGYQLLRDVNKELKLANSAIQHANCFDAEGPRYDDKGEVIVRAVGYIKPEDNPMRVPQNPGEPNGSESNSSNCC